MKRFLGTLVSSFCLLCLVSSAHADTPTSRRFYPLPLESASLSRFQFGNYRLDQGDILQITLSYPGGSSDFKPVVGLDGTISVFPAGKLNVRGRTPRVAESIVQKSLARYYKQSRVTLQLAQTRRYLVDVNGQVANQGTYEVDPGIGICDLVLQAGGQPSRFITLWRSGKSYSFDFLRWKFRGDQTQNAPLKAGDVISVDNTLKTASFSGVVMISGALPVGKGDLLGELLLLVGGRDARADLAQVQVGRVLPDGQRQQYLVDVTTKAGYTFPVESGDQIQVFDKTISQASITIVGEFVGKNFFPETVTQSTGRSEIVRRGVYPLRQGETVLEVAKSLGGLNNKANGKYCRIERKTSKGLQKIPVNLRDLLVNPESTQNQVLQDGDTLIVPALADSVYLVGQFQSPGPYPYNPAFGVREYLGQGGGSTSSAATKHARLIRLPEPNKEPEVLEFDLLNYLEEPKVNLEVKPGDIIFLPLYKPFYQDIAQALSAAGFINLFR